VSAGLLLQRLEPGAAGEVAKGAGGTGYRLVFLLAAGARTLSAALLAASPEPRFRGLTDAPQTARFLATTRGARAWRLLGTGAALQLVVYVASPYFGPFMLEELRFSYVEYMASSISVVAAKACLLPAWGRLVDAHGARQAYTLAALLVAVVPLPWLWARGLLWIVPAQAFSGFSWAGYEVSYFSTMLDSSTKRTRPYLFALQNACNGPSQLLGGLLGASFLAHALGSYRTVFLASLLLRLLVAVLAPRLVPPPRKARPLGRRALLLRMIGIRPHGGVVHRPVGEGEGRGEG
jgi:predicted MFS family arabinose efflux permease